MKKELGKVLDVFAQQWIPPQGQKLEPVDFEELKGVADLLQKFVGDNCGSSCWPPPRAPTTQDSGTPTACAAPTKKRSPTTA